MKAQASKKRSITEFFKPTEKLTAAQGLTPTHRTASAALETALPRRPAQITFRGGSIRRFPDARTPDRHHESRSPDPVVSRTSALAPAHPNKDHHKQSPRVSTSSVHPATSQSSTTSGGSKKTIVNGEHVVLNSDSDSDELEEIDFGVRQPSSPRMASNDSPPTLTQHNVPSLRSHLRVQDDGLRKPPNKYKFARPTLSGLVEAARRDAENERRIAAEKAELDRVAEEVPADDEAMSKEALAEVVEENEEGDKAQRLYLAMQRTNALDLSCTFHFFRENFAILNSQQVQEATFPLSSLPPHGWVAAFEDAQRREQAFLTGFARQIFQFQQLPEELAYWMIDQLRVSQNDALNARYTELLQEHSQHLSATLNTIKLDDIFAKLGADIRCVSLEQPIVPSFEPLQRSKRPLPSSLNYVIQLLRSAGKSLSREARTHALRILSLLCLDDSVIADASTLHNVQEAIEALFLESTRNELDVLLDYLVPHVTHPILQNNLVQSLPSSTPLLASFRQHLALAFIVHPTPLPGLVPGHTISLMIHDHLDRSPDFLITRDTSYASLAARFTLLDLGVGPGLTKIPPPRKSNTAQGKNKQLGLPPPTGLTKAEVKFNQEIDMLAQHIKFIINRISEAGAITDPTRLDAKDNGEKLVHRLQSAARIGGRKRFDLFGGGGAGAEGSNHSIKRWTLGKGKSRPATPAAGGIDAVLNGESSSVNGVSRDEVPDLESLLQEECMNGEREVGGDTGNDKDAMET
ncbi:hypothetical protein K491DRAFT_778675 [Lophiostoma macrostomum CBS 122681]|uniref:Uncharacterized protein n=1 Tax=Lophiostoma macrostomum CBS 122681 TaxID=1314788 RepID=A0A6A6T643_9PLEO|nr:hypothetical protein K491DRAFT_778675 [Lophiostoma macrostomum CBS 122681]